MVLLLLSSAYTGQGLFSFSCPGQCVAGRGHSQDSRPELAKGLFHTIWRHAQYINCADLAREHRGSGTSWASVSQQMVCNCALHHLFCIFFYHYYYYYYYYYSLPFLFYSTAGNFTFFSRFFPHPTRGGERTAVWFFWLPAGLSNTRLSPGGPPYSKFPALNPPSSLCQVCSRARHCRLLQQQCLKPAASFRSDSLINEEVRL